MLNLNSIRDMELRDKLKTFKGLTVKDMRALIKGSGITVKGLHKKKKNELEEIILDVIAVEQFNLFEEIDATEEIDAESTDVINEEVDTIGELFSFKPQLLLSAPVERTGRSIEEIVIDAFYFDEKGAVNDLDIIKLNVNDDMSLLLDSSIPEVSEIYDTAEYIKVFPFQGADYGLTQKESREIFIKFYKKVLKLIHPDTGLEKYKGLPICYIKENMENIKNTFDAWSFQYFPDDKDAVKGSLDFNLNGYRL